MIYDDFKSVFDEAVDVTIKVAKVVTVVGGAVGAGIAAYYKGAEFLDYLEEKAGDATETASNVIEFIETDCGDIL